MFNKTKLQISVCFETMILLQHSPMFPPRFVVLSWSGCDRKVGIRAHGYRELGY
ncbi:hypothetical protein HanRHA438_Chr13g0581721 [Helianthus annuus]|nr:hypothetical protein HanRHA438_Chr13g0581721 [Helianthus annuus]